MGPPSLPSIDHELENVYGKHDRDRECKIYRSKTVCLEDALDFIRQVVCNGWDPYDDLERPTLAEQIELYRIYGDTEFALSLLAFYCQYAVPVPALGTDDDRHTFEVRCRPADIGADYHYSNCDELVRGVTRPGESVCQYPLCSETPSMVVLGCRVSDDDWSEVYPLTRGERRRRPRRHERHL